MDLFQRGNALSRREKRFATFAEVSALGVDAATFHREGGEMSMNRCGSVSTLLSTMLSAGKCEIDPFLKGRTRLLHAKIALPLLPKFQPHVDELTFSFRSAMR